MSDNTEADQIRATAEGVLERARNDETYCASLLADPVAVLAAAGVPADAAEQIGIGEFGTADSDTAGFMARIRCNYGTCIVSACAYIPETGFVCLFTAG